MSHKIYLIPGFFGFSNLGGITYFHHVREQLTEEFDRRDLEVEVYSVSTLPTASIRRRTAWLAKRITETAADEGPIHLIGHSTGGMDARLMATPGANLRTEIDVEALGRRIASVVTVCTPHLGTPIASMFNSIFGQHILWALSLGTIYTLRFGRLPIKALIGLMGVLVQIDRRRGVKQTILEQFHRELFSDFGRKSGSEINEFLEHIRTDRDVVGQLTPGAADSFDASTAKRSRTRYGCVVTRAPGPSLKAALSVKFDVYAHASHALFCALQIATARSGHFFDIHPEQEMDLVRAYGEVPGPRSNDGVVPTLSQIHGEIIHAAWADHLDVCGHFRDPNHDPPHVDWFISGAGFRRPQFEELWGDVASFLVDESTSV